MNSVAELADAVEKLEAQRRGLVGALRRREKYLVSAKIPYPGDNFGAWGSCMGPSLAPEAFVDDVRMFADRVLGIDTALRHIHAQGRLPMSDLECLMSKRGGGVRLRWMSRKGFTQHEAEFTVDGESTGPIDAGWTDEKALPTL